MTFIHRPKARRLRPFPVATATRTLLSTAVAMAAVLPSTSAQAAPTGGVITAGAGTINQQGALTTINQSATQSQQPARMVINWTGFSSAPGESIVFNQPNAAAIALNRVTGASPSQLMGSLRANGQVFILNPNGVLFGFGSRVDVGGLLASTLGMDNAAFMAGSNVLQGSSKAAVVNSGSLKAADGGFVALVGPTVVNDGAISAGKGNALLAAGDKVTLRLEGGSLVGYSLDLGSVNALVDNTANGSIRASGGRVVLEARAADALSKAVVNHAGLIEAQTLDLREGSIRLIGDSTVGQMQVSGTLDASAPNGGNGGFIETSAAQVAIADTTRVTTAAASGAHGTWLIDPPDFEIAPGGGTQTASSIGATTLEKALQTSNVTVATSGSSGIGKGDVTVNADVAWKDSGTQLTLQAYRNIIFNSTLRGNSVALRYGQASADGRTAEYYFNRGARIDLTGGNATFTTQKGSNPANLKNYTIVSGLGSESSSADRNTLQGVFSANADANYVLSGDIDARPTRTWNSGAGFTPLPALFGTFDGLGHQISGLYMNKPQFGNRPQGEVAGLFSSIAADGTLRNLALSDVDITGFVYTGSIAAQNHGLISRSSVSGSVRGDAEAGGLVSMNTGVIIASSSSASVVGDNPVGGLVGLNQGDILKSFSTGSVTARVTAGGLVGAGGNGTILDSYSLAQVTSLDAGQSYAGGLMGIGPPGSVTKNSYAAGRISAAGGGPGGLAGGLIGDSLGTVTNSYWNTDTSIVIGVSRSPGGEGRTGAQLRQAATFTGWDIASTGGSEKTWRIYEGNGMPLLRSFLVPLVLEPARTVEYSAVEQKARPIPTSGIHTGTAAFGRNVGTYLPYSNQQGYDLSNGELVILPKLLSMTATADDKVYDTRQDARVTLLAGPLGGDLLGTAFEKAVFDDKNAGIGKNVTVSGITVTGADAANYRYQTEMNTRASITQRLLDINAEGRGKGYDGSTDASAALSPKPLGTDVVTATYARAAFDDKNVGTDKQIKVSGLTLTGADAANYAAPAQITTGAAIAQRPLDLAITGVGKVYDGNTDASATLLATPLGGDMLSATYARAEFADRNAGVGKNVTVSGIALAGPDSLNYRYQSQATTTASITPRPADISATGADKVYDGTTTASATLRTNALGTDALGAGYATASFDDRNAGTEKNITVLGLALTGVDAGNYVAPLQLRTSAGITPRLLDIRAIAADKPYDGSTSASATLLDNRVAGDAVMPSYQRADFADKNSGQQKAVTVSGIAIGGVDAGNYLANTSAVASAGIKPVSLVVTANPDSRLTGGVPYQGGNGDTYAGFIPGETAAVLDGQLRYGGSAQGAVAEGSYRITPGGLTSPNYATAFVDGTLTVAPPQPSQPQPSQPQLPQPSQPPSARIIAAHAGTEIADALRAAEPALPLQADRRKDNVALLRVATCGVRLPENLLVGGCEPASQPDGVRP